jgi:hypothetical protein
MIVVHALGAVMSFPRMIRGAKHLREMSSSDLVDPNKSYSDDRPVHQYYGQLNSDIDAMLGQTRVGAKVEQKAETPQLLSAMQEKLHEVLSQRPDYRAAILDDVGVILLMLEAQKS